MVKYFKLLHHNNLFNRSSLQKIQLLPEATLWNYIIQLTGAVRQVHTNGLACRTLDPSKILLTDNKSRIRLNCCGILDVLNFDANSTNPLGNVAQSQVRYIYIFVYKIYLNIILIY